MYSKSSFNFFESLLTMNLNCNFQIINDALSLGYEQVDIYDYMGFEKTCWKNDANFKYDNLEFQK